MSPAALVAALLAASAQAAQSRAPDVLLISIDDLRADRVRPDLMPNLSRLAQESVRFASAYSQATWTLPSHATLLTSLFPASHGAGGKELRDPRGLLPGARSLAQALSERGYSASSYANCQYFHRMYGLVEGFLPRVTFSIFEDPVPDATLWFERMPAPAFLFLHTFAVHNYINVTGPPRDASGAWRCPLDDVSWAKKLDAPDASCPDLKADYDRAAHCADLGLGRMFADLKAAGRWDDAVVVVTSDHGESLCDGPDRRRRGHGSLSYDELTHVPLLVKLPRGRYAGRRVDSPAALIDVAPTILDVLGLPAEPAFQGRSLMPLAAGARDDARRIFADTDWGPGVREGRWDLLRPSEDDPRLYDLAADPGETRDLAPRQPRRVAELGAALRDHLGRQSAGWRVAARGRAGARFTVTARSSAPLALITTAFTGRGASPPAVSADSTTVRAELVSRSDGEEGWLILETSTPTATLTLEALQDGRPPAEGAVRLGQDALPGSGPWLISTPEARRRGALSAPPAPRDGITLWRAKPDVPAARAMPPMPRVSLELRAAGYLSP